MNPANREGFCSRYDGLLYIRLNALGAYCLNVTSQYESAPAPPASPWEVLGNGEIIPSEDPLPQDAHLPDAWAVRDSRRAWWLDAGKVLDHVASGGSVSDISRFLEEKCLNSLPEALAGWLSGIAGWHSAEGVLAGRRGHSHGRIDRESDHNDGCADHAHPAPAIDLG